MKVKLQTIFDKLTFVIEYKTSLLCLIFLYLKIFVLGFLFFCSSVQAEDQQNSGSQVEGSKNNLKVPESQNETDKNQYVQLGEAAADMPPLAPSINNSTDSSNKLEIDNSKNSQFNLYAETRSKFVVPINAQLNNPAQIFKQQMPSFGQIQNPTWDPNAINKQGQILDNGQFRDKSNISNDRTLTQVELSRLAKKDVVLIIDKSASMLAMDCPGAENTPHTLGMLAAVLGVPFVTTSRWHWCLSQTMDLSRQTEVIYKQGITVILFSNGYRLFPNVSLNQLPSIFAQNAPSGGTDLGPALAIPLGNYFQRREYYRGNVRPLVIGIITDGCPTNKNLVRQAIVQATNMMRQPEEITIIFFLVGSLDFQGERFVQDLSLNLAKYGAKYPIVRSVTFSELETMGLAKALVNNLR